MFTCAEQTGEATSEDRQGLIEPLVANSFEKQVYEYGVHSDYCGY